MTDLRVVALLERIDQEVRALVRYRELDRGGAMDDDLWRAARYSMVVAIGACIDLAALGVVLSGKRSGGDPADPFRVLGEAGVLPDDLVPTLVGTVGFREQLVYRPAEVDQTRVRANLHWLDLGRFASVLRRALQE